MVRSFVDIVSKNGNLLIGIGPQPDGTIPAWQQAPLLGLGRWLEVNGEAIFGSRPWQQAAARTSEGTGVRSTQAQGALYATLLETPGTREFAVWNIDATGVSDVRLLGLEDGLTWSVEDGTLTVTLPTGCRLRPPTRCASSPPPR